MSCIGVGRPGKYRIEVVTLFLWIYGGYHAPDVAVDPGKRWPFFLGLRVILLYRPLHAYRRYVEDWRANDPRAAGRDQLDWALTRIDVGHCRRQCQA